MGTKQAVKLSIFKNPQETTDEVQLPNYYHWAKQGEMWLKVTGYLPLTTPDLFPVSMCLFHLLRCHPLPWPRLQPPPLN